MRFGEKVTLKDNETDQIYEGNFSSENNISISLKNVNGFRRRDIIVFAKSEFSLVDTKS